MKKKLLILTTMAAFSLTSCATIFTGTRDMIRFNSQPQGAEVRIDGLKVCNTPCSALVKRSLKQETVDFKLDGYETKTIGLEQKFNAVSVLNLLSLLNWAIDAATGSVIKYDRKSYDIEMSEMKAAPRENRN